MIKKRRNSNPMRGKKKKSTSKKIKNQLNTKRNQRQSKVQSLNIKRKRKQNKKYNKLTAHPNKTKKK